MTVEDHRKSSGTGAGDGMEADMSPADADPARATGVGGVGAEMEGGDAEPGHMPHAGIEEDDAFGESIEQLEGLQAELGSLNDRHLRLAAEFDNYRKRVNREREELRKRAEADLVEKLLEPLDDLQRVVGHEPQGTTAEALHEGASMVEKKLRRVLETLGLEPIDADGQFFNPETMEALMAVPAEHPEDDDVVAEVFQKGYRFHGMLIRPARVRVKKYEG